jgi:ribose 5-phosphate isomerase B
MYMRIGVAFDHAGFLLKQSIMHAVRSAGHEPIDLGTDSTAPVDYPDYAVKLASLIQAGEVQRGIIVCGSGVGVCIAANKIRGVYAGVCHDTYSAHQGVEHDDMNVLCLGARIIGVELAREIVLAFLNARFIGNDPGEERHIRRVAKVRAMERSEGMSGQS